MNGGVNKWAFVFLPHQGPVSGLYFFLLSPTMPSESQPSVPLHCGLSTLVTLIRNTLVS